jgi:Right handed beta helix region
MKSSLVAAAGAAALLAGSVFAAGPAHAATIRVVSPGQSIQAAVDAAQPGDTIQVRAGTYHESVLVEKDNITIQGAGASSTILLPPAQFPANRCGQNPPNATPSGGGICFLGQWSGTDGPHSVATQFIKGGRVTGIRLDGFVVGIATVATDGIRVDHVTSLNSAFYGITHVVSKNGLIDHNTVRTAGHAGIYVGNYNVPESGSNVTANDVSDGAYGISTYDSQGVTLTLNNLHGSCAGYLAYSDNVVIPGGDHITFSHNLVADNNATSCPSVPFLNFPAVSGSGIVLVGNTASVVEENVVARNRGTLPLSGGIMIGSTASYRNGIDEGSIAVNRNVSYDNGPADVVWDQHGTGITFTDNLCATSAPSGLC